MSTIKTHGIVCRYANYRESDRMLNIFTDDGMIGAAARGCRRPKSPLISVAELFVYGEFVLFEKQGKYTVGSCEVLESFYPLRQDMDRLSAGTHMLEMVNGLSSEGQRCNGLLELLYYSLSYLTYADCCPLDMAICFTVKSLAAAGYTPAITYCADCGQDLRGHKRMGFSAETGGALCGGCMENYMKISPLSLEAVRRMLMLSNQDIKKVRLPDGVRRELKAACGSYAEHILEKKMKSFTQIQL